MLTMRVLGGVALLLAGSSWLWLTPAFASRGVTTTGALWDLTQVLCLIAVLGFMVASWAVFARQGWWEPVTLVSVAVGAVALLSYVVAALRGGEPTGTALWNVFVHVLMVAGIVVLLVVPRLEHWVDRQVTGS